MGENKHAEKLSFWVVHPIHANAFHLSYSDIDACLVETCANNSHCLDLVGGYDCICDAGYENTTGTPKDLSKPCTGE